MRYFLFSEDQIALKVSLLARWCTKTDLRLIQRGKFNTFWVAVLYTASNQIHRKLWQQPTASAPSSHCVWQSVCVRDGSDGASAFNLSPHFVHMQLKECFFSFCASSAVPVCGVPYKVDSAEAAMANLSEVREKLLRVFFEEKLRHLRILQAACPDWGGHSAECSPLSPTQRGGRDYLGAEQHRSSWRFICGSRYAWGTESWAPGK